MSENQGQNKYEKGTRTRTPLLTRLCKLAAVVPIALVACLGLILAVQCLRPLPKPAVTVSTERLLRPPDPAAPMPAARGANRPTSAPLAVKQAGAAQNKFEYPPLLPDAPDLPPALKAQADEINLIFNSRLRLIEEYERV